MNKILIPVMLVAVFALASVGVTNTQGSSSIKTETTDGFSFNYPNNWDLKERENPFTSVAATLEYDKGGESATILFEHDEGITDTLSSMDPIDALEQVMGMVYDDASIFESGADKYLINNQTAPYVLGTYTKSNIFGYEHDYVSMVIAINLGNDDMVLGQYVAEQNDFDKLLSDAEEIFQSVKPVAVETPV